MLICCDPELEQLTSPSRGMEKRGGNTDTDHLEGKKCLIFAQEG